MIYFIIGFITWFLYITYSNKDYEELPILRESWFWDKSEHIGTREDSRIQIKPRQILNGYKTNLGFYSFRTGQIFSIAEQNIEYPLLGRGIFGYNKIGNSITYYSQNGEILWKKKSNSYPVASVWGNLNFLVSGDGNQVLLIDLNGNQTGIKQADGRFLVDITQNSKEAVLLFSGGEVYWLSEGAELIKKYQDQGKHLKFYKSVALSESGEYLALHYFENMKDFVSIFHRTEKFEKKIELPKIYTHKLYMSLSSTGSLLINAPNAIMLFTKEGKLLHKTHRNSTKIYQVAFATSEFCIAEHNRKIVFLDNHGFIIKEYIPRGENFRIIPYSKEDFFLETEKEIVLFHKF